MKYTEYLDELKNPQHKLWNKFTIVQYTVFLIAQITVLLTLDLSLLNQIGPNYEETFRIKSISVVSFFIFYLIDIYLYSRFRNTNYSKVDFWYKLLFNLKNVFFCLNLIPGIYLIFAWLIVGSNPFFLTMATIILGFPLYVFIGFILLQFGYFLTKLKKH